MILGGINQNSRLGNIFEYSIEKRAWSLVPINKNMKLFKGGRYGHSVVSD